VSQPVPSLAPSPSLLRRARPLLGTLVDIRVEECDTGFAQRAVAAAFAEIETVHRLMSFHEAGSDLARLNRARPGDQVLVDTRTAQVLRCAEALRIESAGAFDCAVADALVAAGLLPPMPEAEDGAWETSTGGRVEVTRSAARLDLGGIAKGYAVDRAVDLLLELGIRSALVNAGGDLRHIGAKAATIRLRDPADPSRLVASLALRDRALASSASSGLAGEDSMLAPRRSALIDPRSRRPLGPAAGVSVTAPSCMVADALTKVVLVTGDVHHPMLAAHAAEVVLYRAADGPPA
jgi:thiamine biosynthesis lipoprotein